MPFWCLGEHCGTIAPRLDLTTLNLLLFFSKTLDQLSFFVLPKFYSYEEFCAGKWSVDPEYPPTWGVLYSCRSPLYRFVEVARDFYLVLTEADWAMGHQQKTMLTWWQVKSGRLSSSCYPLCTQLKSSSAPCSTQRGCTLIAVALELHWSCNQFYTMSPVIWWALFFPVG
jgi:hypothetical protein